MFDMNQRQFFVEYLGDYLENVEQAQNFRIVGLYEGAMPSQAEFDQIIDEITVRGRYLNANLRSGNYYMGVSLHNKVVEVMGSRPLYAPSTTGTSGSVCIVEKHDTGHNITYMKSTGSGWPITLTSAGTIGYMVVLLDETHGSYYAGGAAILSVGLKDSGADVELERVALDLGESIIIPHVTIEYTY